MKTPGFPLRGDTSSLVTQPLQWRVIAARHASRITFSVRRFACLAALLALSGALSARAQTDGTASATNAMSEADKVWKETSKLLVPPMPPAEWQMQRPTQEEIQQFREQKGKLAAEAAGKAKDFYTRFPDHPKAAEARKKEYDMLQIAMQLGNTNVVTALEAKEQEQLKDPSLSEDERFKLRFEAERRGVMAKMQSEGESAGMAALEKSGRTLIKEFPKHDEGYQFLLEAASNTEGDKARSLAKEIAAGTDSKEVKAAAEGLLKKLDALGKPVDIKFTAVDGREVDVSKMGGKVVLVDFWATWCGPCVRELPNVKAAYDKLHPKGFEIVGISFDVNQDKLTNFVADQKMGWVQYFDGKQWQNKFGQQYGINSIPTMWLVDKKGNLRDMNARGALEEKVEKLLAE